MILIKTWFLHLCHPGEGKGEKAWEVSQYRSATAQQLGKQTDFWSEIGKTNKLLT